MLNYYDLTVHARTLLMTLFFSAACFALVAFLVLISRRRLLPKLLLPVCVLVSGAAVSIFADEARAVKFSREIPAFVRSFCEMPLVFCILLLLVCVGYTSFAFVREQYEHSRKLSRASVKESLDQLPTGLCFYRQNGRTVLVNDSMYALCYELTEKNLQNAALFWQTLSCGEVPSGIERLESGDRPSFRFRDGRVWTFSREDLGDIVQLVAADTTELSNINAELKLRNADLAAVNARLREYGERVDELTRTRERIDIKANIHRELGQALLITRRYLIDESGEAEVPVGIWKKNVAMLACEAENTDGETPLSQFLESAAASGVSVELSGEFPEDKNQEGLFVMAAIECLVNGVRHADANTLFITVKENETEISVTYENDGALPKGEIVEGGGLSSLRHRVKRLNGKMKVFSEPRFSLVITLPKERSEEDGKIKCFVG
jgi:signal transduction histidine kinase